MNCNPEIIADNSIGNVTECQCGTVTINCGNAAIRIPKRAFSRFAILIDSAYAAMVARELSDSGGETFSK